MKIRTTILTLLVTAGVFGGGYALAPATYAAGVYHVVTSKAVSNVPYHWNGTSTRAYLWNSNLTTKQHHLTNYPKTTWYATKVLKMTNGHKTGIFYYVNSAAGKTSGYVWKGYLVKGAYSASVTATGKTESGISKDNPGGIPNASRAELTDLKGWAVGDDYYDSSVTYYQDLPVIKSFTGTTKSKDLSVAALDALHHNFDPTILQNWKNKLGKITYIKFSVHPSQQQVQDLTNGKLTFSKFVLNDLKKQQINLDQYKGWQIGMGSTPIYKKAVNFYSTFGTYAIALLSPQK